MATRFRRYEIIDHSPSLYLSETTIPPPPKPICLPSSFLLENDLISPALDLVTPTIFDLISSPFEDLETITELVQIKTMPSPLLYTTSAVRKLQRQLYLQSLCDRVSALELGVDRLVKDGLDRKYKLTTEIKGGDKKKKEMSFKWTAEIKGKGDEAPISRKYTY